MFRGSGVSKEAGLGGYTNGDVGRQGTVELPQDPCIARVVGQFVLPLGAASEPDPVEREMDHPPGAEPARRLESSSSANSHAMMISTSTGWVTPRWTVRAGTYQVVTFANGNVFDNGVLRVHGDVAELAVAPRDQGPLVRLMTHADWARMGG